MTLQPDYDSMIEQLLGDASLNDVQRAALRKAIECDTKARKELAQAEKVERILRAEAERTTPSQATVERLLGYAIAELTVEESGQSADYPSVAEAKGSAGFSVAAWLTSLTVRVASAVRTNRVFALGSLGGDDKVGACEVPLEHPDVNGSVVVRRVDAVHVEVCVKTVSPIRQEKLQGIIRELGKLEAIVQQTDGLATVRRMVPLLLTMTNAWRPSVFSLACIVWIGGRCDGTLHRWWASMELLPSGKSSRTTCTTLSMAPSWKGLHQERVAP